MACLVYRKKLSLVWPDPKTCAIVDIIPSLIRCESKIERSSEELTYSINWESLRSKKCRNSSTDCKSDRLLELPAGCCLMFKELIVPFLGAFFFLFFATKAWDWGCSTVIDVLKEGDGGLGALVEPCFLTLRTGSPASNVPVRLLLFFTAFFAGLTWSLTRT